MLLVSALALTVVVAAYGATLHLVETVRVARLLDVALDVGSFLVCLARLHLEVLHNQRVDATDDDSREDQQSKGNSWQQPASPEDRRDEERGTQQGDDGQDLLSRQHCVHVCVRRPLHRAATREGQAESVEVVGNRLADDEHEQQQREVGARSPGHSLARRPKRHAAEHVVRRKREQRADDDQSHDVTENESLERQDEREIRDVAMELRILVTERVALLHNNQVCQRPDAAVPKIRPKNAATAPNISRRRGSMAVR